MDQEFLQLEQKCKRRLDLLGIEPRTASMLKKHYTTKPQAPFTSVQINSIIREYNSYLVSS